MSWTKKMKRALEIDGVSVSRYYAHKKADRYIVWAEDRSENLMGDGVKIDKKIIGTVDFFTKDEDDPAIDLIEDGFDREGVAYRLNSVQYEEDTTFIHHEWVFEVF